MSIMDILGNSTGDLEQMSEGRRYYGIYVGKVTDNKNPDDEHKVKVLIPSLHDNQATFWARVGNMMAGAEMGSCWLPEVDDEVIVGFANGDDQQPIVLGCLWNGQDKMVQSVKTGKDDTELKGPNNQQGGDNNYRFWYTRSGHLLCFSDEDGKEHISLRTKSGAELMMHDEGGSERIELYDQNNEQFLEINVPDKKITLQTDTGEILIKAKTKITLECEDYILDASNTIQVDSGDKSEWNAGGTMKQTSGGTFDLEGGGDLTAEAPNIHLNP